MSSRLALSGRIGELDALSAALRTAGPKGRMVVVHGPAGSGKTALLAAAADAWRRADAIVVTPTRRAPGQLVESIAAASAGATLRNASRPGDIREARRLLTRMGKSRPTVLVVDDVPASAEAASALLACRSPGVLVVVSCGDEDAGDLPRIADFVITPAPLSDKDMVAALKAVAPLDESVLDALRTALGDLFGNPGTVMATVADLRQRNRLVPVHGRLCLADPGEPIALPATHHLLARVAGLGDQTVQVLSAVAGLGSLAIHDLPLLADVLGVPIGQCGRAVDALTDGGVLTLNEDGAARCICPALATAILDRTGHSWVRRLHAGLAVRLSHAPYGQVPPSLIAHHASAAGTELPDHPRWARWLTEQASAVEERCPNKGIEWYGAALRLMSDTGAPDLPDVLAAFLRLVIPTARYDLAAEVLPTLTQTENPELCADLRSMLMLTSVHWGMPLPEEPGVQPSSGDPVELCRWWLGQRESWEPPTETSPGSALVPADELRLLHNALRLDAAACAETLKSRPEPNHFAQLLELSAAGNIAGVMRAVLGPRFREPDAGPAAVFARVHRGYTGADWGPALSAARQLETMGIPDSPLHQMARVYAAGIHLHRGEHHLASEWLATVTRAPRFACARAVVECNLLHFTGQHRQALDLVLRTAHEARRRGLRPVQDRLQLMGVQIALRVGDQAAAHEFLRELRKLHRAEYTLCTSQVVLLGRALIHRDSTAAAMAVDVVRRRGHKPDLLWAAQILAQFCDDPRPVMDELHTFAREGDPAFLLHDRVATLLQRFDIRTPSDSGARPFSPTQQRIIDLVTAGHTNRQIATELSISEKRVQSHLTQLFAQTGCRSRVQLAAASINNQLAPRV